MATEEICLKSQKKKIYTAKAVILGDGGVGKTCLMYRLKHQKFLEDSKMTIGLEFHTIEIERDDMEFNFQVWDLGGQDQFFFMHKAYLKGASGFIYAFDLTRPKTLYGLKKWVDLTSNLGPKPSILVATKMDLTDYIVVSDEMIREQMDLLGLTKCFKISSKTGENVQKTWSTFADWIIEGYKIFSDLRNLSEITEI